MIKFILTPLEMFIEEETETGPKRINLPEKLVSSLNIKNINPKEQIKVELTLIVDEIDVEYSSVYERRKRARDKLRNELRQEA